MRKPHVLLVLAGAAVVGAPALFYRAEAEPAGTTKVVRVVDGDSYILTNVGRVRLIGVDTPETVHPTRAPECYGREASDLAKRELEGKTVRYRFERERRDRYGRLLVHIAVDGRSWGERLIRYGYGRARFYAPNVERRARYETVQRIAVRHRRGLWGACPA